MLAAAEKAGWESRPAPRASTKELEAKATRFSPCAGRSNRKCGSTSGASPAPAGGVSDPDVFRRPRDGDRPARPPGPDGAGGGGAFHRHHGARHRECHF
jgi:hypothetical protein